MAKVIPLRQALVGLIVTIGSMVWLVVASRWSEGLLRSPAHSAGTGGLAVALAVLSVVPWIYCVAWSIAAADEYVRHIAIVGTALAFVVGLLAHIALNVMIDAGFVAGDLHVPELVVALGAWLVGCAIAILYYRQRR